MTDSRPSIEDHRRGSRKRTFTLSAAAAATFAAALTSPAAAHGRDDVVFSLSWRGRAVATGSVSAGDLLVPAGGSTSLQAGPADVFRSATSLGLTPASGCQPEYGRPCGMEIDALSCGRDDMLPRERDRRYGIYFSVDRHASGAAVPLALASVTSEALDHDQGADIFRADWEGEISAAAALGTGRNLLVVDGNGIGTFDDLGPQRPGSGGREPNPPGERWPSRRYDGGDDLDALQIGVLPGQISTVYFSLEAGLQDPLDPMGTPTIPSSAGRIHVSGADVLTKVGSSEVRTYASASQLGLDRTGDDIDALVVSENGTPNFQCPTQPFGWETDGDDMVLFSLRRGSISIGRLDSALDLPICEGDLLAPPASNHLAPRIVMTAESLGLRSMRTSVLGDSDDLDGASFDEDPEDFLDCNDNDIEDRLDIVDGTSYDFNENGIPDECEYEGWDFCVCPFGSSSLCSNGAILGGCSNAAGTGALLACLGEPSLDDGFGFTMEDGPPNALAVLAYGEILTFPGQSGNGLACLASGMAKVGGIRVLSPGGTLVVPPGILETLGTAAPSSGQTGYFQIWYRDLGGPCGFNANWTNGVALTF